MVGGLRLRVGGARTCRLLEHAGDHQMMSRIEPTDSKALVRDAQQIQFGSLARPESLARSLTLQLPPPTRGLAESRLQPCHFR